MHKTSPESALLSAVELLMGQFSEQILALLEAHARGDVSAEAFEARIRDLMAAVAPQALARHPGRLVAVRTAAPAIPAGEVGAPPVPALRPACLAAGSAPGSEPLLAPEAAPTPEATPVPGAGPGAAAPELEIPAILDGVSGFDDAPSLDLDGLDLASVGAEPALPGARAPQPAAPPEPAPQPAPVATPPEQEAPCILDGISGYEHLLELDLPDAAPDAGVRPPEPGPKPAVTGLRPAAPAPPAPGKVAPEPKPGPAAPPVRAATPTPAAPRPAKPSPPAAPKPSSPAAARPSSPAAPGPVAPKPAPGGPAAPGAKPASSAPPPGPGARSAPKAGPPPAAGGQASPPPPSRPQPGGMGNVVVSGRLATDDLKPAHQAGSDFEAGMFRSARQEEEQNGDPDTRFVSQQVRQSIREKSTFKSPAKAVLLSAILPGVGDFYVGAVASGAVFYVAFYILLVLLILRGDWLLLLALLPLSMTSAGVSWLNAQKHNEAVHRMQEAPSLRRQTRETTFTFDHTRRRR